LAALDHTGGGGDVREKTFVVHPVLVLKCPYRRSAARGSLIVRVGGITQRPIGAPPSDLPTSAGSDPVGSSSEESEGV
jgi:hypothetical protein